MTTCRTVQNLRRLSCSANRGLIVLLFAVLLMGCVPSRFVAHRIITAPNRQATAVMLNDLQNVWGQYEAILTPPRIESPLVKAHVSVGDPAVELEILSFPPQDYGCEVASVLETNEHGKGHLTLTVQPKTNYVVQPLPQIHRATIVLLHGYMLTKEFMLPWALQLAQSGYRVVLVDLRGHGKSGGAQITFGKQEVADLKQVLDYLQAYGECDEAIGVMGFSYGATLALHWAADDSRVRTVVAIAPYNRPDETFERLVRLLKLPISASAARKAVALAAERLELDWTGWSGEAAMRKVRVPVLLISGEKDEICPPEDIAALQSVAGGETEVLQVSVANHLAISVWMHELIKPVERWLGKRLVPRSVTALAD